MPRFNDLKLYARSLDKPAHTRTNIKRDGFRGSFAAHFPSRWVVSSSFRGLPSIMFGIITNDDQVKDDQATQVVRKGSNFVRFGAKLAEEAFQQVR